MTNKIPTSKWDSIRAKNPNHSSWYYERFETLRNEGADLLGEARFVDMLSPRHATILDAGCGPGRHVGYLDAQGHTTVGVDGDEILIAHAKEAYPDSFFICQNLVKMDMAVIDMANENVFDTIFAAGNVITFLHPDTVQPVLEHFFRLLKTEGKCVVGFGAGRGLEYQDFIAMATKVGFELLVELETWHADPLADASTAEFFVPILRKPAT